MQAWVTQCTATTNHSKTALYYTWDYPAKLFVCLSIVSHNKAFYLYREEMNGPSGGTSQPRDISVSLTILIHNYLLSNSETEINSFLSVYLQHKWVHSDFLCYLQRQLGAYKLFPYTTNLYCYNLFNSATLLLSKWTQFLIRKENFTKSKLYFGLAYRAVFLWNRKSNTNY